MRRHRALLPLLLTLVLLLAACSSDDADGDAAEAAEAAEPTAEEAAEPPPAPADAATAAEESATEDEEAMATDAEEPPSDAAAADAAVVTTADSDHGTILVDGEGNALYLFTNDTGPESTCTGGCLEAWPPLLGEPTAEGDADAGLLGTTERDDGSLQVLYNDHPLYHYAADAAPGDTNGQGVGDVWYLVSPAGDAVQ